MRKKKKMGKLAMALTNNSELRAKNQTLLHELEQMAKVADLSARQIYAGQQQEIDLLMRGTEVLTAGIKSLEAALQVQTSIAMHHRTQHDHALATIKCLTAWLEGRDVGGVVP